jgi:hypothetical protein
VILARKADRIRFETRNWAVHAKSQETPPILGAMARKYGVVPLEMMIDPTCLFINLYAAFCYAIVYL